MGLRTRIWVTAIVWNMTGLGVMCLVGVIMTSGADGATMAISTTIVGLVLFETGKRIWLQAPWGRAYG